MAMLAEKRRKSKFVLNPISKPLWSTESSQFGRKMMEKMGWTAGKGLGAAEQGIQEPLRALYKQDSKGVGYSGQGNPFENLDQFNALLTSLSGASKSEDIAHSFESLEEKSKHSRSRVHYKKFTRSKDVSKYSNMDLSCIVGVGKSVEEEVTEEEDHTGEEENSHGVTTINSGSLSDYFKLKMSQRKYISLEKENSDKDHDTIERRNEALKNTANDIEDCANEENSIEAINMNINSNHSLTGIYDQECTIKKVKKKTSKSLSAEALCNEGLTKNDANYPEDKLTGDKLSAPISREKKKKRHRGDKEDRIENKEEPVLADEVTYENEKKHHSPNKELNDFPILKKSYDLKESKRRHYESAEVTEKRCDSTFTPQEILKKSKRRTEELIEEKKIKKERKESSDCTKSSKKKTRRDRRIDSDKDDHETFDVQEVNIPLASNSGSCKKKKKSHKSEKRKQIVDVDIAQALKHKKEHHHKEGNKCQIDKEEVETLQSLDSKILDGKARKKCKGVKNENISEEITAPKRKNKTLEKKSNEWNEDCLIVVEKEKKVKTKSIEKGSNRNKMDEDLSDTDCSSTEEKRRKLEGNEFTSHTEVDLRKDKKGKKIGDISLLNGLNQECAEISKCFKGSNLGTLPGYGQRN